MISLKKSGLTSSKDKFENIYGTYIDSSTKNKDEMDQQSYDFDCYGL